MSTAVQRRDYLWLSLAALLLLLPGLGLRDPWPADEPRFALIARDMVLTGNWLFPMVGGDLYQDKPPLFFWTLGVFYWLTGNLKFAFLLPSLLAGLGTVLLTYDLARRVWDRHTALCAAGLLLCSLQWVIQARAAQIDMLLAFWTTLGLYGLGRHLLTGPDWRAYTVGGFACGLGIITKGTGFLPMLLLLAYFPLRSRMAGLWRGQGGVRWALAPAAMLVAIALWFVPMVIAVELSDDPALRAYRDELLFQQTVTRYSASWAHHEPWYYFLLQVIPPLWLPGTLLLPWLAGRWLRAVRAADGRIALLLAWVAMVILFFSASPGKRGVYVLPALPAFVLLAAPWLSELLGSTRVRWTLWLTAAAIPLLAGLAALYLGVLEPQRLADLSERYDVSSVAPLACIALLGGVLVLGLRPRRAQWAWAGVLVTLAWVAGLWIYPMIDGVRSGREFVARVETSADPALDLGWVAYREQYLLHAMRPVTNFGHRRVLREGEQETFDAARWLNAAPNRRLVIEEGRLSPCFDAEQASSLGHANRRDWFLVGPPAAADCAQRGEDTAVQYYRPPQQIH
ncbi:MAG: ArnT family glycosyltransferase [Steroidobacteraceae bacterium]